MGKDCIVKARYSRREGETLTLRFWTSFAIRSHTIQLPFGAKWVLEDSELDAQLRSGAFERAETRFVKALLQQNMTVLDVGAHHGYYTLLASKLVKSQGIVVAFEPSERECVRLERHVRLNKCRNVMIERSALGAQRGEADLYLVDGAEDYCNSLRPPVVKSPARKVRVPVETLDEFLERTNIGEIDFIKLDVEGAELDVLKGASQLLGKVRRPVFMIEVYDIRTGPWGYAAREIVHFLMERGYKWHSLEENGEPVPIDASRESFDANLVAVPAERLQAFAEFVRITYQEKARY